MKISDNAAETIRRILDNRITYYLARVLVYIGNKIFNEGGNEFE
jgi:hypothetical protein